MPEVIEKPVDQALDITPIINKEGKQTGEIIRAALPNISDEDLGNLFDQNSITPEAQYVIRTWHNNCEMDEAAPEWMKSPTPEQNESLQSVPLDARLYKKAMSAIDLENRKVTKDKDGKVATLEVTGHTYDSNGKKVEVRNWTKDGKKLFSAQNKTDIYNFAIRAAATLSHEEQYADNVKQRIKRGFRTIEQRESKSKFVTTMLRFQDAKKKTIRTTGGREIDQETLNRIERLHPELLDSNE